MTREKQQTLKLKQETAHEMELVLDTFHNMLEPLEEYIGKTGYYSDWNSRRQIYRKTIADSNDTVTAAFVGADMATHLHQDSRDHHNFGALCVFVLLCICSIVTECKRCILLLAAASASRLVITEGRTCACNEADEIVRYKTMQDATMMWLKLRVAGLDHFWSGSSSVRCAARPIESVT